MIAEPALEITDFAIGANDGKIKNQLGISKYLTIQVVGIDKKYTIGGKFQKKPNFKRL